MAKAVLTLLAVIVMFGIGATEETTHIPVPYDERFFDFGHVGIDFKLYHNYYYRNRSGVPVRIKKVHAPCDCSAVTSSDSVVAPGDSVLFRLAISTKDFFGQTNKHFTVHTSDPKSAEVVFGQNLHIGQWLGGFKPAPISVFLLPGQSSRTVTIPNSAYDDVTLTVADQADTTYSVSVAGANISTGESFQVEFRASEDLRPGTHMSSATFRLDMAGVASPMYLTIPVKIVRY